MRSQERNRRRAWESNAKGYNGRPVLEHVLDWLVTGIIITLPIAVWNIAYLWGKIAMQAQMVAAR